MNEAIRDAIRTHELATAGRGHRATYELLAFLDDFGAWEPIRLTLSTGASGLVIGAVAGAAGAEFTTCGYIMLGFVALGAFGAAVQEISPALAGPLTRALEWLAARRRPITEPGRDITLNDRGKQRTVRMPDEPIRPEYATVRIPSSTLKDGWRDINVEELCGFLKSASITGMWQKRNQKTYKPDEWADIRRWVLEEHQGVWGETPPTQFLYAALPKIRTQATNQTNQPPTNQKTSVKTLEFVGRLPSWFYAAANDISTEERLRNIGMY